MLISICGNIAGSVDIATDNVERLDAQAVDGAADGAHLKASGVAKREGEVGEGVASQQHAQDVASPVGVGAWGQGDKQR